MSENHQSGYLANFSQWFTTMAWRGRRKWVFAIGLVLLVYAVCFQSTTHQWIFGPSTQPVKKKDLRINGFSPDNRLLSFDFCPDSDCFAGLLNLQSGEVAKILPPNSDERWSSGRFSPSGKYLAFAVKRASEKYRWSQLGLYDISANTMKILTHTESFREWPSFSPDGKRLIFAQANRERESGKTRFSDWDIYELEIESGKERRLTDFQFFLIGHPSYLPDGKHFIFSGEGPNRHEGKTGVKTGEDYDKVQEANKAYKDKYQDNRIFILRPEDTELHPAFTNGPMTIGPDISRDGKRIVYMARSDDMDRAAGETVYGFTFDIFMLADGRHHRLTKLQRSLPNFTISPEGSLVAYSSSPLVGNGEISLWLLDISQDQPKQTEIATGDFFKK